MILRFSHRLFFLLSLCLFSNLTFANVPYYGGTFSYVAIGKEPTSLQGFQVMLNYDPQQFQWRKFNVYFDGGYSRFWEKSTDYDSLVNVYSIAPVVRYLFRKRGPLHPYLELSIGVAYLDHTYIEDRNLGMHFSFQDRMGLGVLFGNKEQFLVGFHALHYSNGRLCSHNSGFTAPLVLDVGLRFQ